MGQSRTSPCGELRIASINACGRCEECWAQDATKWWSWIVYCMIIDVNCLGVNRCLFDM